MSDWNYVWEELHWAGVYKPKAFNLVTSKKLLRKCKCKKVKLSLYICAAPWRPMEPLQTHILDRQKSHLRSKTVKVNVFLSFNGITKKECRRYPFKAMLILYLCNSWRLWRISRSGCFNFQVDSMVPTACEVGRRSKHPLTNIYVEKAKTSVCISYSEYLLTSTMA
jgi:hypothetical protein